MLASPQKVALVCACAQRGLLPSAAVSANVQALQADGWHVRQVRDLCELAALDPAALRDLAAAPGFLVAACRPRAVQWLLHFAGIHRPLEGIACRDLRPASSADPAPAGTPAPSAPPDASWPAWFPVIDYDRCTRCGQCVNFCAFGVYTVVDGAVVVTAPSQCKDNCPACARICPALAIIFPKVTDVPINGDVVTETDLARMRKAATDARSRHAGRNLRNLLANRRAQAANSLPAEGVPPS